jgi:GT2 family glycosyltransferase
MEKRTGRGNPHITICTVNYNGLRHLKECFDSILKSNYPMANVEVVMIDNASTDGSVGFVESNYPWVKLLSLDRNYGFSKANNLGAKSAGGEYIVFLNNDTVVTPEWLNGLVGTMESDSEIGIVGSKLLMLDRAGIINSAGSTIAFNGGGYDVGFLARDAEQYNVPGRRGGVCAAAMMVRRDEFLDFGGFDEDYFMYFEDVDLCWRYWLFGRKVFYAPSSVVFHKFGGSSGAHRHAPLRVFYGTRNSLLNILKNYELHNIPYPLMFSFFYHLLKVFYFLIRLDTEQAGLMIKAYCSLFVLLPKVRAKRKLIQDRRKVDDAFFFRNSLIASLPACIRESKRLLRA